MSFGVEFETALQADVMALTNFQTAVASGMSEEEAFTATMVNASAEAQAYAQAMGAAGVSTVDFATKQKLAQVSLTAQNKSLINCKSLIAEYNSGCANVGVSQTQFISAIQQSNAGLAKYLSGLNGASGSLGGYITSLVGAKVASIALQAATMALNMAITMGLSFALQAVVSAITHWINAEKEARQAVIEAGQAAVQSGNDIYTSVTKYLELSKAMENGTGSADAFADAQNTVLSALGLTGEGIDTLIAKYGDLKTAILDVAKEQLDTALSTALAGVKAGQKDAIDELVTFFGGNSMVSGGKNSVDAFAALAQKGYISSGSYGTGGGTIVLPNSATWDAFSSPSFEDMMENYKYLEEVMNYLSKDYADTDLFSKVADMYNTYGNALKSVVEDIDAANNLIANGLVIDAKSKNSVDDLESYIEMRNNLISQLENDKNFNANGSESASGIIDTLLSQGNAFREYSIQYQNYLEGIQDTTDKAEDVFDNLKKTFKDNSISQWFDGLSDEEKEFVYQISVRSDDTTLWTLDRWKQELQTLQDTGSTTSEQMAVLDKALNGVGDETGLSEKINNYTSELSKLEDVLTKIDTGTLTENDKISLALEYPELAGTINDTDALKNAIQDLIDTSNQGINNELDSMIDELSESAPQAAAALQAIKDAINGLQSTGGFNFDIEAEIQKFDNLYGAMKNSVSGTGLKSQDIENVKAMFSGLKGYDPSVLFERTEHGIHLNTTALRALQSEYESTKKLDIQNELRDLKQQYNDTKTELEGLTKGTDEYNQKMAQLTGIENQINDVQTLAAQYEGLTSAYNKWIMAQSAGEEGDMYDSITNSLEDIKKLYDDGLIGTNAFRAAVQMMTDEDLSTASIDKLIATYEAGYPAMERYFTKGHDGALTFLEDVQKINTEWAKQNEDGSWEIDFGIGNDAEIAQAISDMTGLKVSTEEVQMIMRKLSDYGFDIKLDSAYTSIDELKSRIEESEEKLKELGQEPIDIDVNVELDSIDTEIEKAQQLIAEINASDIDPDVKTAQLDDANNKLDVLISKKLEATEPAFMQLSTSDVDSGLASTLTLLQQFQNAVEQEYICTVKGDTAGVEEAHSKVESLAQEIAALDSDTLAEIGITLDTSSAESTVSSVKSSIETGDVSFGVDVDTSGVESAKTTIDSVDGKDVEVTVTADNTALDNLKTALDSLQDKTITVTANTVGTENVDTLKTSTDALIDKTVTATANAVGKENVDALKQSIDSLYDRTVTSTAKVVGTNLVIALKAAIDALYNKTVSVGANVFGTAAVQGLRSAIDSLYSKTVTATTVTRTVAGVDGTAHANGTAFAQGDWGTKEDGVALGGELGQELVKIIAR